MRAMLLALGALAAAAGAQTPPEPPAIRVIGHGVARTAPDVATITFGVRGEGATSDDAVRALVARRAAITAALAGKAELRTGRLAVTAARDKACDGDDDERARLSTGACTVRGYVASLGVTAKVTAVAEAGTLLGLAGRLGATDPALEDFALLHPADAQRAATEDAIRDAQQQAAAIAAASHVVLGRLRRVEDQRAGLSLAQDIVVTGSRMAPPAPPPIVVSLSPAPIETRVDLVVEYEVGGAAP